MIKDPVLLQGIEITGKFLYLYNQPFPVTKTSYVRKKVEKFSNKIFLKPPVARSYRTSTSLGLALGLSHVLKNSIVNIATQLMLQIVRYMNLAQPRGWLMLIWTLANSMCDD